MTPDELKTALWKSLDDSPIVMLGLAEVDNAHTQPMAAQIDPDLHNCVYFFTNRQNRLVDGMSESHRGFMTVAAKGHDLFASVHGTLVIDNNRAMIEKFWSPIVDAWYEDGKDDPNLTMMRFDLESAEIWNAGAVTFLKSIIGGLFMDRADELTKDDVAEIRF